MGMPVITNSGTTRAQAVTDLIESVALQETAIAHIINAEGEKIQKYTAVTANPTHEQLMAVNKSVDSVLRCLTNYEIILQSQLKLFANCICNNNIEL